VQQRGSPDHVLNTCCKQSNIFSKRKYYDGSSTLKMVGHDCKMLKENCKKFVSHFLKVNILKLLAYRDQRFALIGLGLIFLDTQVSS
jgi:hypothetical protein